MVLLYVVAVILSVIGGMAFLIRRKHLSHWVKLDRLITLIIISVLLSPICVGVGHFVVSEAIAYLTPRPLHPTYEVLEKQGFYVFVLPEQEVNVRGWQQDITIWSWSIHCGMLTGDTYNPLTITYRNNVGDRVFEIQHGPWDMLWDYSQIITKTQVTWESELSGPGSLTYHTRSAQSNITQYLYHFSDMQGEDVDISSNLSVTETLELIKMLEYVGPPIETLTDPWDCKS